MSIRGFVRNWILAPLTITLVSAALVGSASGADGVAGSQGIDTSLPATDSQVTVSGHGPFNGLSITVNQTKNLVNQAVSVTWTGGRPTISGPGRFAGNYLQIFQCWGEPTEVIAGNPGPPPEKCGQGASGAVYGGLPGGLFPPGYTLERIVSRTSFENFDASVGEVDPVSGLVWRRFQAVDGKVVGVHTNPTFNPSVVGGQFWLNPYFNINTTNEIAGGLTRSNGSGAELFEVQTGLESPGLGCGQRVERTANDQTQVPQCWIVVVPRGTPTEENAGTPFSDRPDQYGVVSSPLAPAAWANRIAIPVEFNPIDSPCSLGDVERRLSGNDLAFAAVTSWQPSLCRGGDLPPYSYAPVGDTTARQQLLRPSAGSPGMVVFSRKIDQSLVNPTNPIVYAPLTASGLVFGFNVERTPSPNAAPEEQELNGIRIAEINLTPRLVAKLLTQSYRQSVTIVKEPPYEWLLKNSQHLGRDPDFLRFNPEFSLLEVQNSRPFSGLQLPSGTSDAAQQVWEWILADPEASAWLSGEPDEWGMRVNPVYSTNAQANPTGAAFGVPTPNIFPKADPYCYQAPTREGGTTFTPPPLCGTDWIPYVRNFADAAKVTRSASDRPRIVDNSFAASASEAWTRELPQLIGRKVMISLTDSASATQYGIQTARLSQSGDNGPERKFVGPTASAVEAGISEIAGQEGPAPLTQDNAYPLAALTYAAIAPLALDQEARNEYASFIDYAVGPGQAPGSELGQLPVGYVPLPGLLVQQAKVAADAVRNLQAPAAPIAPAAPTAPAAPIPPAPATPLASDTDVVGSPTLPNEAVGPSRSARPPTPSASQPAVSIPTVDSVLDVPPSETSVVIADATEVGEPSVPGVSAVTPATSTSPIRLAMPAMGVAALGSALAALEITKRPRRTLLSPRRAEDTGALGGL